MPIKISDCQFAYKCPLKWEDLTPTRHKQIRNCEVCKQLVIHCETDEQVKKYSAQKRCIAINVSSNRYATLGVPARPDERDDDIPF